jgi:hypothetical protein
MTPWEFQHRADQMRQQVQAMDAARATERKHFKRAHLFMLGAGLFNVVIGLWNVATFIERACRR